jgi:hypothetical protein
MKQIEDYAAECRAYWRNLGFTAEWADQVADGAADGLYRMYETSRNSPDGIVGFDGLLKILRSEVSTREKLSAVAGYVQSQPRDGRTDQLRGH